MLALIYCAELGFWHAEATEKHLLKDDDCETDKLPCSHLTVSTLLTRIQEDFSACENIDSLSQNGENKSEGGKDSLSASKSVLNITETMLPQVYRYLGYKCVTKYLEIAEGPLLSAGWETSRARVFSEYFSEKDIDSSFFSNSD